MAIAHAHLQKHLDSNGLAYSVSGTDVTLTGSLSHQQILEAIRAAEMTGYRLEIVAGVPKLRLK